MRPVRAIALLVLVAAAAWAQDGPTQPPTTPPAELPAPKLVGPRTGAERKKALARYGGSAATEQAVAAALDWLARHQADNGLWDADGFDAHCETGTAEKPAKLCEGKGKGQHGEDIPCPFDAAISGFALLAFLGDGHLPDAADDRFAPVVKKAVAALEGATGGWEFPIVAEALAELEAMERKGTHAAQVKANTARLADARDADGAWGYWGQGSDVPFATLCASAIAVAPDGGGDVPADTGKKVDTWLTSLEEVKGKLAYRIDGRNFGYTPTTSNAHCAVAIRELLGAGLDGARHRAHLSLVAGELPVWKISYREVDVPGRGKVPVQIGNLSMYQWYFGTVGAFQHGGETWTSWFGAVKTALLGHQVKAGCARGSWDPEGWYEKRTGGRVWATALGALMLEQPYRHRRLRG
ncbi:MAG: hypothetical protein K8T90_03145 [Planctomycetes bacterium]|nr:hypothetical protein [Planctomycetota bacterium]